MMDMDAKTPAIPWLDQPVLLHSSRKDTCKLTQAQCEYRRGHWRYWYQSDHVYALATVYFMCATIGVFMISRFVSRLSDSRTITKSPLGRWTSIARYAEYKTFRSMAWVTPTLGISLLIIAGSAFFFGISLGPQPYYWPNTKTVSYGGSPPLATRTGWMAVALLPFVVALSSKQNYITALTGVSHEKLQLYHQACSWAMFVLALVHTFPFIILHIRNGDMVKQWNTSVVYWTGVAAIIPQAWLTFMSLGSIRNRYYDFFKSTHLLAALVFVVFFFIHCDFRFSSWDYFIATGALYLTTLIHSQLRTYFQYGFSHRARLTLVEGDMLKISGPIYPPNRKPFRISWTPGQHIFIRFPSLGLHGLTSHPFTICSLPPSHSTNKIAKVEDAELIFYVKPKGGITARLAALASKTPNVTVPILLDGPYGGLTIKTFAKYDRVLLIAGGAGAGFTLPLIEDILRHQHISSSPQRLTKIHIILSTKCPEKKDWFQKELDNLRRYITPCSTEHEIEIAEDVLTSSCFVSTIEPPERLITSPYNTLRMKSSLGQLYNWPSDFERALTPRSPSPPGEHRDKQISVIDERADSPERIDGGGGTHEGGETPTNQICKNQTFEGRPNLRCLIKNATSREGESVGIAVCGPKSMCFDVKNAAAEAQLRVLRGEGAREVYLHSETFGW